MHTIHNLEQGSDAWHAHRAQHFNASEAAAMLGISPHQTRSELLHQKATGLVPEVDAGTQRRFDDGHAAEAAARPIAEGIVGSDLYPITASLEIDGLPLSASYDGATMEEDIIFECKLANQELKASLAEGRIPDQYKPQMEQQLLILGATKCLFMASNGDGQLHAWYESDPKLRAALIAGWKQFRADMDGYTPPEVIPAAVAAPIKDLPAIIITSAGSLAVTTNFDAWEVSLREFVAKIPQKPSTDQEFADCKAAVAALKKAEGLLDAEEARVLASIDSVDEMKRHKKLLKELSSTTRLALEKLVVQRDIEVKREITQAGRDALALHMACLNKRLAPIQMPQIDADFAAAIKSKRNLTLMRGAVADLVAAKKIESNEIADKIDANLKTMDAAKEHAFLFNDRATLVMKEPDDLALVIKSRIQDHKAAEDKRLEAEREKIRAEEEAKAERREKERQAEMAGAVLASRQKEEAAATHAATQLVTPAVAQADAQSAAGERMEAEHAAAAWPAPARDTPMTTGRLHDMIDELTADMTVSELAEVLDAAVAIVSRRQARAA